ncbi:queuine tRNA-ribosyltransferase accessory subunit 2 [Epargyreus clarus]|uniref:queuine tRNA-ribosyltransferase accessory subunit 2 n=1 Tax=Epargyreus clarus TaxID=520877 RepID=UPI003C3082FD
MKMRFVLKQTGVGSERLGQLTGFMKSPNSIIETPTAALFTQGGSVVNITAEVLAMIFTTPQMLWVPVSNSMHLENGLKAQNEGVAKFAGLSEHFACVTLHSMSEATPAGHFEQDKMPVWTKNGKKLVTADRYMDLMELYKPDMYMVIADGQTSLSESKKRMGKAVERTCKTLNKCMDRHKASDTLKHSSVIGVIVATADSKQCDEFIEKLIVHKESLCGVTLQGITDGSDDSFSVPYETLDAIFKKIGESIPNNLLRIIEGCWSPPVILAAIERGWDLFDGSFPLKLTNAGLALRLNLDINKTDETPFFLNLKDVKYKEDFTPILASCECLACRKHTRAYIRHLLNTREMLAGVLLSIHNLHHFDQFFHHARRHIAEKTFDVFKDHITKQCNAHKLVIPVPKEKSEKPDETLLQSNKKKRIEAIEVNKESNT